ncbi:hypothetical protein FB45DRAFT_737373 [Roridomyces roridus]|uniref:Uncharacterized protein n=1 Tax=Roridomyces roridus TaxID=1738132 RepID=A0AAD7CCD7_9AGAR|nr:hypothetical protein FB45DRAFT_737373 [Roridomyces roridus]
MNLGGSKGSISGTTPDNHDDENNGAPKYTALRKWEEGLPQHNLSLPFPEGKTGRYVKFSNQMNAVGWNNVFSDVLMSAHLAYVSGRGYVFQDYFWAQQHYPWPTDESHEVVPRTPLPALVAGPVSGGPFEPDGGAPRSISSAWFDVVCPPEERRLLNTRDVKPGIAYAPGDDTLVYWQAILRDAPEGCIEIVPQDEGDWFPQVFDLGIWGSTRLLSLWDSFAASPISRLLKASPIVGAAVERNQHLFTPEQESQHTSREPFHRVLAIHIRRGDYEGHCGSLVSQNMGFYSWNQFPHLLDRLDQDDTPGREERARARCFADRAHIVRKAAEVRRDYHGKENVGTLDVVYILTNEKGGWIDELREDLRGDGWARIVSTQDLVLDREQRDVGMAVDMEIGRKAEVFLGNGWSSFTANIVYERLIDKRDPLTIRFI